MSEEDVYIKTLKAKLDDLQHIIIQEKKKVRGLLEDIKQREEQIDYIIKLIKAEGVSLDGVVINEATVTSVSDMAYEVLSRQNKINPVHYRELADMIIAEGKLIPGKDPAANLIAHLTRDNRFIRTSPGTYAIVEWGLKPMPKSRKRRIKKTISK